MIDKVSVYGTINLDKMIEQELNNSIDQFLNNMLDFGIHPLADKVSEFVNQPSLGSHLVTKRTGYEHHGIYVGKKKVIQYSGFSGDSFNIHDITPIDNSKRSPIEVVSLEEFEQGCGYRVQIHNDSKFSSQEIIDRAYSRINETEYNLVLNNCESFVNWCIYDVNESDQVHKYAQVYAPVRTVNSVKRAVKYFNAYLNGNVSKEKLFKEISYLAVPSISIMSYTILGQASIPIPGVGAMIGATAGYVVGNLLYNTGLLAIGDSDIVKISKARRQQVEEISATLIPVIQNHRNQLENYMQIYFKERHEIFDKSFKMLDTALLETDTNLYIEGLVNINKQYNQELSFKNFNEFDKFMKL